MQNVEGIVMKWKDNPRVWSRNVKGTGTKWKDNPTV
jgi:hypothetical protein